jgi:hypothetical protein
MNKKLADILERARGWPESDQAELAEYAEHIESRLGGEYQATPEELQAIDEADRSGIATEAEVEAAFHSFRRA